MATPSVETLPAGFHELTVAGVEQLTEDSVAVSFELDDELADSFAFIPGQSLVLRRVVGGVEHRRNYSICSAAGTAPRIGVRAIPDGVVSNWLVGEVAPGDRIQVHTPDGSFRADPDEPGEHLCIGAGSGITPLFSIAASVLANPDSRVTMLYGNRKGSTVMFADELADLKDTQPDRFNLMHVLSREPHAVELFSGRLDADRLRELFATLVPVTEMDHVWLCGPFGMLESARLVLDEVGVDPARVHVEHFHVDEPPPELRRPDPPVDGATSTVTVLLDGRSTTTVMPRDSTILDSAQKARGDVPFACKGGVCGTCRARVTAGEVEMVRNFALEADQLEEDFVLTCQSFPVSDEATIEYDG